ncbi:aminoacyl--tRNA ligase-related protein [Paenibacillus hexagrammi]|uniref:aminoacyl--tRNA ligase-related protein n=1 Tax=Paenibacillus hexagrammi TaxID=2908839 RepID=UPI00386207C4
MSDMKQVVICKAVRETASSILQTMISYAEEILQLLELPYRVSCRGLQRRYGWKNYKQFDIETWMPSRGSYGETHSASNLLDFQARRSKIRYKDEEGQLHYPYTLNNTAVASPRILIPLLENHQREDGSIYVPEALRPYMRGITELR